MRHCFFSRLITVLVTLTLCLLTVASYAEIQQNVPIFLDQALRATPLAAGIELLVVPSDRGESLLIQGSLSRSFRGDMELAGKQFIHENREWFPCLDRDEQVSLRTVRNLAENSCHHFTFQPVFQGLPLHGRYIDIHFSNEGIVTFVTANVAAIEEARLSRSIEAQHAIKATEQSLGATMLRKGSKASPVFHQQKSTLIRAWLVEVCALEPLGDFEVVVDAQTGEILHEENQISLLQASTGKGNAYPFNPMHGGPVVVDLPYLTGNTPAGLYVQVTSDSGSTASNGNLQHLYEPTNPFFDQINVYYHINRMHDFYRAMGFTQIDSPVKAVVHFKARPDSAFFSPKDNMLAFGGGVKLKNLAQEEAVIYHEYAHCALRRISNLSHGAESGAINEGQADYFAATLSNDPIIGEWVKSQKSGDYLRKIENKLHYPEAMAYEIHADGRIWGGALWDLRKAVGPKVADLLIHKSIFYLNADASFYDGFQAILQADRAVLSGSYQGDIIEVFSKRGMANPPRNRMVLAGRDLRRWQAFSGLHQDSQSQK